MSLGIWQIALIVLVIFLFFGAGKFPRVMEDIAKGIKGFKKGMSDEEIESKKDDKIIDHAPSEKDKTKD